MKKIELLAPAGNLDAGLAAINCGADAVYIGAERFGAREAAGNSLRDIEKLCRHAHKYWGRVYGALNTILTDAELTEAQQLTIRLAEAGIDGLIIQDTGLLELDLPPMPLIASTQMHNNTPAKVAFLERAGFSRVILARELTLEQIRDIRQKTGVELEFFVHGALCVCYSGQCYMSYAIGGRSGNRGQCAQPCRRRYTLEDADKKIVRKQGYLLSLKDLNLSEHLAELVDAGITSFKIEGRLKDAAYVANIVAWYRSKLDRLLDGSSLQKSSSGTVVMDFSPDPDKTFNRGYTIYFLKGRSKDMASPDTPAFTGVYIGKVEKTGRSSFVLNTAAGLHSGDGICFFDRKKTLRGTYINTVQGREVFPAKMNGIEQGMEIYRNLDHWFAKKVLKSRAKRVIGVSLQLRETPEGFSLSAVDEDGNETAFALVAERKRAEKKAAARATIEKQLRKLGETDFFCMGLDIDSAAIFFIPVAVLNAMRRGVVDALLRVREKNRPIAAGGARKNSVPYPEDELSCLANVLNRRAEDFYRRHGVTSIERAVESGSALGGRKLMTTKFCLRYQLDMCAKHGGSPETREPLFLADEDGRRFELRFNCGDCMMEVYHDEPAPTTH
jgi:putative protease